MKTSKTVRDEKPVNEINPKGVRKLIWMNQFIRNHLAENNKPESKQQVKQKYQYQEQIKVTVNSVNQQAMQKNSKEPHRIIDTASK